MASTDGRRWQEMENTTTPAKNPNPTVEFLVNTPNATRAFWRVEETAAGINTGR